MLLDEYLQDLQKLTRKKPPTYEKIAEVLDLGSKQAVSNRIYRKQPLKDFEIEILDDAFKNKILKVKDDFQQIKQNYKNKLSEFVSLPVKNDVTASMGYGVEVFNETQSGTYQFSKKLLNDIGANPNYSDVIFSSGDSMYPTIDGGDCLVVDKSKTEIHDGKIYCVRIDGQLYAKRLQKIPPQKIKVISDNKDKYDPFYVDFSKDINFDFAVIGEVKWWSRVAR